MADSTTRLQIEMDAEQMRQLDSLASAGGCRTKKELINSALTLLKWAVNQKQMGFEILSENPFTGVSRELQMPFLEHVASIERERQAERARSRPRMRAVGTK